MSYLFTVSPGVSPAHISGWYFFNTWLQKNTGEAIHLEMYEDFGVQHDAIAQDKIDLIYANPHESALLLREKGFQPLAKPESRCDEALIAVRRDDAATDVGDLKPGVIIALSGDPDARLLGKVLLESVDLTFDNIVPLPCDSHVLVAKSLLRGECDAGLFSAETFDDLSQLVKKQLRVLTRSETETLHHSLMAGPRLLSRLQAFQQRLMEMKQDAKGSAILDDLGFSGWSAMDNEEMQYMIDIIDALET
ncbi:MAG: phosphate/phosphite/phosphonate ABC transporter substrate-binding protein [Gammaproteobacteria bacterium]